MPAHRLFSLRVLSESFSWCIYLGMTTLNDLRASLADLMGGDDSVTPQLWGRALAVAYQRTSGLLRSIEDVPMDARHSFMTRSQELGNTQAPIFRAEVERCFPSALSYLRRRVEEPLKEKRESLLRIKSGNWDWQESHVFDLIQREIWLTTTVSVLEEQLTRVDLLTDVAGVTALHHYAEEARVSCLTEKDAYLKAFASGKAASELLSPAVVVTRNEAASIAWKNLTYFLKETLSRVYSK